MIGSDLCQFQAGGSHTAVHPEQTLKLSASVVTIGAFDGVHRGHQHLLRRLVDVARRRGVPAVVYTFDVPPKVAFGRAVQLTPPEEKIRRLSLLGLDHVIMAGFNAEYAARPAEDFVDELRRLNPRELWVGEDFRFGKGRSGDIDTLRRNFRVSTLHDVTCRAGDRISSTTLRRLFAEGRSEDARKLHGWPDEGCLPGTAT